MLWYSTTVSPNEFPFISEFVTLPLKLRLLTFGFLTWIPLVAYCQTTKLSYNKTFVTGSSEINQESEALDFIPSFASDFQYNLRKLSFHLALLFPQVFEKQTDK